MRRVPAMSLSKMVGLMLVLAMAASAALSYVAQRHVFLPRFLELEREEALKDLNRCVESLEREMYHLDVVCADWAAWDDTYEFVEEANAEYVASNLVMATFIDNKLNLIYIINYCV